MSYVFLLSPTQMSKIELFFPRSHGVPRVDDRRIILGIVYVIKHVLQWKDAPRDTLMIDATHLKAHRTGCSLLKGGTSPTYRAYKRIGGVTKRDKRFCPTMNTKLHAVCDGESRPLAMCLTVGQTSDHSDHVGAKILYPALPDGTEATMIADKGYAPTNSARA